MAKIAISMPDALLSEIDRVAGEQQMPRSELIRKATSAYLELERTQATVARASALYAEIEAEDLLLADSYRPLIAESLPPYRVQDIER
ncbi:MAG: ribbon-helix-helix protein, CopG family [Anaerolineae bacterium]|nr:ribbon-helix-helix protein, CopG family [Anaerolineae bacterium]MCB0251380.1 ribbon-helix-helix protein, CopG family [Anaerolineae bacterium]MCB9132370.1 ribbon-helix-helix protein, CopG family [Anaerolineales bacterium]MCB9142237.1 ribbon-helix-helix protein, CopG family [Anaerolineales bacterium]MCO5243887.1 ribbon-helix-helix protein, CopG family [Anaerolineae bacterium]